jgi:CHRD domain-containing protein
MNMKKLSISTALLIALAPTAALAEQVQATLIGYKEVPVVSTDASGTFRATIANDDQSIKYELTYSGLQAPVLQAHIHVAQLSVNGSIIIWLCGTATNPGPAGTQTCPQSGTVTGTITAANVVAGSTAQQLGAADLEGALEAIRAGTAYANVHTNLSPGGEIRGQIRASVRGEEER